jgi:DNA-binding transcriptional ArsR family regulator
VFVGPPPAAPRTRWRTSWSVSCLHHPIGSPQRCRAPPPTAVPVAARPFVDHPAEALAEVVEQMRMFWDAALAPWWRRLLAALDAEIASRACRLATVGAQAAFAGLHPTETWDGGFLCVHPTKKAPTDVELGGRGVLRVPAALTWPSVWPRTDPPWDPALVYPPAGLAELWAPDERRDDALGSLLGRRRARILLELERPSSTLGLAQRLGVGPSSVSDHLGVLRRAGLVAGRREGRRVVYARTANGDALCLPG